MSRVEFDICQYDKVTLEVLAYIKEKNPKTLAEAEKAVEELLGTIFLKGYEPRLLAVDMFIKGYLLGRHGEKIIDG